MNRQLLALVTTALAVGSVVAQDAQQIVAEAQRRTEASSQHYEGTLQVIDSRGKIRLSRKAALAEDEK